MSRPPLYALGEQPANLGLDAWLAQRILAGWDARAVAVAGGVSLRTAYRWRRELVGLESIRVGEHVARFAIRNGKPPVRVSDWREA